MSSSSYDMLEQILADDKYSFLKKGVLEKIKIDLFQGKLSLKEERTSFCRELAYRIYKDVFSEEEFKGIVNRLILDEVKEGGFRSSGFKESHCSYTYYLSPNLYALDESAKEKLERIENGLEQFISEKLSSIQLITEVKQLRYHSRSELRKAYDSSDISRIGVTYDQIEDLFVRSSVSKYIQMKKDIEEYGSLNAYPDDRGLPYGISYLHLVMLMEKWDLIYELVNLDAKKMMKSNWLSSETAIIRPGMVYYDGEQEDVTLDHLYDYRFIAGLKGKWDIVEKFFIYTTDYKLLSEAYKKIEKRLKQAKLIEGVESVVRGVAEEATARVISSAQRVNEEGRYSFHDEDRYNNNKDIINNYKDYYNSSKDSPYLSKSLVENLTEMLAEIEQEIESARKRSVEDVKNTIENFKKTNDEFIRTVLKVYEDINLFTQRNTIEGGMLLEYRGILFWLSTELYESVKESIRNNTEEEQTSSNKTDENVTIGTVTKPNGDKWFSDDARKDVAILRCEYFELAKKYHPDVFSGDRLIFLDIQKERAEILEYI